MKTKFLGFLSTLFFISTALVACNESGGEIDESPLFLKADKLMVNTAADSDYATFTVTQNGMDLTKSAEIWLIGGTSGDTKLASNTFSTKETGIYQFEARYSANGTEVKSTPVTVKADVLKEVFFRKIFVQKFTSTNCTYCPSLTKTLNEVAAMDGWKDRMIRAEFHTDFNGVKDPMHHNSTNVYKNKFGLAGLPGLLLDFMSDYKNDGTASKNQIVELFTGLMGKYPAMCGVAIDSKFDKSTRKVTFTTKVKASWANEFTILPMLLEDKIMAPQNGDPYEHNHALRALFTDALLGDALGVINSDQEVTKTYEYVLPADWNADNMSVAACALIRSGDSFIGNNSTVCPINSSVDYIYNKE